MLINCNLAFCIFESRHDIKRLTAYSVSVPPQIPETKFEVIPAKHVEEDKFLVKTTRPRQIFPSGLAKTLLGMLSLFHRSSRIDLFTTRQKVVHNGGPLNFKVLLFDKKTNYLAQILQSLSYKVCSIILTNFNTFGLFTPILGTSAIMDQTACFYIM